MVAINLTHFVIKMVRVHLPAFHLLPIVVTAFVTEQETAEDLAAEAAMNRQDYANRGKQDVDAFIKKIES